MTRGYPQDEEEAAEHECGECQEDEEAEGDGDGDVPALPLPPDGGWGWMVVLASLVCNIIVDGVTFSFGVFLVAFVETFNESRQKTAWIGSLIPAMYLCMGPIVSGLANKYGIRLVTIVGAVAASAAFILSTFSPNIDVLIFVYGILGGISFGFIYLPSIIVVNYYFDRRRSFATGIALCGSGIGTFIFAPFGQYLLDNFGWRGSYWIIAAIILNIVVCGLIFRPLEARTSHKRDKEMREMVDPPKSKIMQTIIQEKNRQRTISTHSLDGSFITRDNKLVKDPKLIRQMSLLGKLDEEPLMGSKSSKEGIMSHPSNGDVTQTSTEVYDVRPRSSTVNKKIELVKYPGSTHRLRTTSMVSSRDVDRSAIWRRADSVSRLELQKEASRPMYRADILYTGSVTNLAEFRKASVAAPPGSDREIYVASVTSIPAAGEDEDCGRKCAPALHVLREMFDFRLIKSPTFCLVCASSLLAMLGFFTPFVYVTSVALDLGITPLYASYLVSVIGLTNTLFRIIYGWVCDRPWADCLLISNVALIIGGLATCLVPFLNSFPLLAVYCALFGACIGVYISSRPIVLVDLLGIHRLNNSFGLLMLVQGIATLVGSPAAGAIYDSTQSYSASFISSGAMIAMAGLLCLPIRRLARWENATHPLDGAEERSIGGQDDVITASYSRIDVIEKEEDSTL